MSFNYKKLANRCEDKFFTDLIKNYPFKSLLCVENCAWQSISGKGI